MNKKRFTLLRTLMLICCLGAGFSKASAQTLGAGDIAFTGYNCNDNGGTPNQVSFVILRNGGFVSGTQLHLTDNGYNKEAGTLTTSEGDVLITFNLNLPQFTEVYLKVSAAGTSIDACTYKNSSGVFVSTNVTASVTGTFILGVAGDQVLAFQGSLASPTFISGIHMNSEVSGAGGQPATTAANWDATANANGALGWIMTQSRSAIPPGLANGTNAIMPIVNPGTSTAVEKDNAAFNCSASVSSSAADMRSKINNVTNWSSQDVTAYTLPTNCSYIVAAPPAVTGNPSAATTCAGGGATFQVTASNATGYQWQVSVSGGAYTDITASGIYSGVTTPTLTLSNVTAAMNGNSYQCVVTGNVAPTANSSAATLTVNSPGTWTGAATTAWSNTANWSCGVLPTATTDVTISGSAVRMPVVDINSAICNNITLGSGATLGFTGTTNALEIKGTVTNNGTITATGGKVIFSGGAQTVPALTYTDLQVTGGNNKTLAGTTTISGTLTLTNGLLVLGSNNLTINGTGAISGGTNASFIVTNGTGQLTQNNIGTGGRTGTVIFPVGSSTTSFTRAALSNSGTADNFTVKVSQGVFSSYTGNTGSNAITQDYVNKTWFISEGTAGGSNVNLTLEWTGADQLSGFNNGNCQIAHFNGTYWVSTGTPGGAAGLDPYTISRSGITQFSPFAVGSSTGLPLQLLSFTGIKSGNDVVLDWKTAQEKNISHYVVERSANSRDFTAAGSLKARQGGGIEPLDYSWTDADILKQGNNWYYRLSMVHEDGSVIYSPTIRIQDENREQQLVVYPNPLTGDVLNIRWKSNTTGEKAQLIITDVMGRVQQQQTVALPVANTPLQLHVPQLAPGQYWLRVGTSGSTSVLRFTKQ